MIIYQNNYKNKMKYKNDSFDKFDKRIPYSYLLQNIYCKNNVLKNEEIDYIQVYLDLLVT